mmetsp:Transcript_6176/g.13446  ORF Transcript_6176/g.13446 Transcript_6176/m.13446 type:complete len:153 (+) Transcript_6176:20-478(+)
MALACKPGLPTCTARQPRRLIVRASANPDVSPAPAATSEPSSYFVVKNVFKVKQESYTDFENVWKSRESHLKEMPGFIRFAMMKCTNIPGKYVSETHWANKAAFENWAKSSQFQASHAQPLQGAQTKRPNTMAMLEGPPAPEFYETVTTTSR